MTDLLTPTLRDRQIADRLKDLADEEGLIRLMVVRKTGPATSRKIEVRHAASTEDSKDGWMLDVTEHEL